MGSDDQGNPPPKNKDTKTRRDAHSKSAKKAFKIVTKRKLPKPAAAKLFKLARKQPNTQE